ncbi:Exodeoxyribonuclease 7 large subunit [Chelatococcus asaccharovorans]|nr:Exodeoxyribonuclease 7 large subunit [Chelatococcus asaccharovorans]CAH1679365.1 Exodeoxyribonuclease 7 large subunit [Chelatococcus asaccharovorans]
MSDGVTGQNFAGEGFVTNLQEWTVSGLSGALKRTLEDAFGHVRLKGEVSGYRGPHSSGHCYFALKDESAKLEAVIWKGVFSRLKIKPQEGLEVVVTGRITTFPGSSKYQIIIETIEPAGVGALMAILEERRRKLAAEGLFDEARKQLLPFLPTVIGVVTSPTGAVIRDILHRLEDRFPSHVLVWPVRVQGETSAAEVAAAIRGFNALPGDGAIPRPDVIIVARGGGSLEDLWSFNDEAVVRAAADSDIPLVSAVGHETDWTLIDYAADLRCPTPTGAAEKVVPVRRDLALRLADLGRRHGEAMARLGERRRTGLRSLVRALRRPEDLVAAPRQRLDLVAGKLAHGLAINARRHEMALSALSRRLARLSPHLQLEQARARLARAGQQLDRCFAANSHRYARDFMRVAGRLSPHSLRLRVARGRERLVLAGDRLGHMAPEIVARRGSALERVWKLIESLGHKGVLARGYALVLDEGRQPIRSAGAVSAGMPLTIMLSDGDVDAVAVGGAGGGKMSGEKAAGGQGSGGRGVSRKAGEAVKTVPSNQSSLFDI